MIISNQELFDNACLGIIGQNYKPALSKAGDCVVLTSDGLRCALGWSCDDAVAGAVSSTMWCKLSHRGFGEDLRRCHDLDLRIRGRDGWETAMARLALKYGLDDSCLWMTLI